MQNDVSKEEQQTGCPSKVLSLFKILSVRSSLDQQYKTSAYSISLNWKVLSFVLREHCHC